MSPKELLGFATRKVVVRYQERYAANMARSNAEVLIWAAAVSDSTLAVAHYVGSEAMKETLWSSTPFALDTVAMTYYSMANPGQLDHPCEKLLDEWKGLSCPPAILEKRQAVAVSEVIQGSSGVIPFSNLLVLMHLERFYAFLKRMEDQAPDGNDERMNRRAYRALYERFTAFRREYLDAAMQTVSMT